MAKASDARTINPDEPKGPGIQATTERKTTIQLSEIIGFPPNDTFDSVMSNLQLNIIPWVTISPCIPKFSLGMTLFTAEDASVDYAKRLANLGFSLGRFPLVVAFIPDNPPSDTISNEYGESFLNKITDVVSSGAQELNFMLGGRDVKESLKRLGAAGEKAGGVIGGITAGVAGIGEKAANLGGDVLNAISPGAGDLMSKLMAGNRIDFPFVWKNSGYTTTASITVRLYNPFPRNDFMNKKYIVGPLMALLCLATPISDTPNVYSFPYIHKIKCRGLFHFDPGTITNISIVKGAENQIAFNQRPSLVDVRIDFGSLFSVLLNSTDSNRPTLWQYKETLEDSRVVYPIYRKREPARKIDSVVMNSIEEMAGLPQKKVLSTSRPAAEETLEPEARVSQETKDLADSLSYV